MTSDEAETAMRVLLELHESSVDDGALRDKISAVRYALSEHIDAMRECPTCDGYGHFTKGGRPTLDRRDRKCLDCQGTGRR